MIQRRRRELKAILPTIRTAGCMTAYDWNDRGETLDSPFRVPIYCLFFTLNSQGVVVYKSGPITEVRFRRHGHIFPRGSVARCSGSQLSSQCDNRDFRIEFIT